VCSVGDRVVLVRETAEGALTIEVTEESRRRSFSSGLLPTQDTPIGTGGWDEDGFVASLGPTVRSVRVRLTDGTMIQPELRAVDGSAAQYVVVGLSAGVQPERLEALDGSGNELAALDYRVLGGELFDRLRDE
jgi:hypothetical protein